MYGAHRPPHSTLSNIQAALWPEIRCKLKAGQQTRYCLVFTALCQILFNASAKDTSFTGVFGPSGAQPGGLPVLLTGEEIWLRLARRWGGLLLTTGRGPLAAAQETPADCSRKKKKYRQQHFSAVSISRDRKLISPSGLFESKKRGNRWKNWKFLLSDPACSGLSVNGIDSLIIFLKRHYCFVRRVLHVGK